MDIIVRGYYISTILVLLTSCDFSERDWEIAKREHSISSYNYFLSEYPEHPFADSALIYLEELEYDSVKYLNTIPGYQYFLTKYPGNPHSESIRNTIKFLKSKQSDLLDGINSIKLIIEDEYDKKIKNKYPFQLIISILFEEIGGIDLAEETCDICNTILKIKSDYKPVKAFYISTESKLAGEQYTGAEVEGEIKLLKDNNTIIYEQFLGNTGIPEEITREYSVYSAPFTEVFSGSFGYKIIEITKELFGEFYLLSLLRYLEIRSNPLVMELQSNIINIDKRIAVRLSRDASSELILYMIESLDASRTSILNEISILGNSKNHKAVMPLIFLLEKDVLISIKNTATQALRKLTGEDFGKDYEKWKEWWDQKKDSILVEDKM
jgi:hypothetical protein